MVAKHPNSIYALAAASRQPLEIIQASTYGYDPAGQLTSTVGQEADHTARRNEQFGYDYDPAGNLLARTNGALVQTFTVMNFFDIVKMAELTS